jgi:hypothetical protein
MILSKLKKLFNRLFKRKTCKGHPYAMSGYKIISAEFENNNILEGYKFILTDTSTVESRELDNDKNEYPLKIQLRYFDEFGRTLDENYNAIEPQGFKIPTEEEKINDLIEEKREQKILNDLKSFIYN